MLLHAQHKNSSEYGELLLACRNNFPDVSLPGSQGAANDAAQVQPSPDHAGGSHQSNGPEEVSTQLATQVCKRKRVSQGVRPENVAAGSVTSTPGSQTAAAGMSGSQGATPNLSAKTVCSIADLKSLGSVPADIFLDAIA